MSRLGFPLIVCAPSGAGKTTLIKRLKAEFDFFFSISCTTRAPRADETDAVDYTFISRDDFLEKRRGDYFAEWAEVHGNFYGTPLVPVQQALHAGRDVLFDIDIQGASQLALSLPQARLLFILPPSMEVLEQRLRLRGTDSDQAIAVRLENSRREIAQAHWFHAWVINNDLEKAYAEVRSFYISASLQPVLQPRLLQNMLKSTRRNHV